MLHQYLENIRTKAPLANLLTPNIPEAEVIAKMEIKTKEDMIRSAEIIYKQYECPVLCKGGHFGDDADDLLYIWRGLLVKWSTI